MYFGDERYVRWYGREPVAVELTEDPEGTYWGWMGFARMHYTADKEPIMVQPHRGMFDMQFPYGPEKEVEKGQGEIVRCTVREIGDE